MDLEMTGLEPQRHVIIEIATLITDDNLNVIAEGPDLVIHASPEQMGEMGEFVTEMHTKSGLIDAVNKSTITNEEAEAQTLAFLKEHIEEARSIPLCGNSIGTDRRFLQEYMPTLEEFFHYRNVDVSTLKELTRRWHPEVLEALPGEGDRAPRPRRHPRIDRGAAALPRHALSQGAGATRSR